MFVKITERRANWRIELHLKKTHCGKKRHIRRAATLHIRPIRPIHQWLAVTGSVNQLGEVQPIGGVSEKIEGFFESCSRKGLTGKQGVIVPARNTKHLAIRRDVVEAVESGHFSVYAVNTIEEALELLTGVPAGERGLDGAYPSDSVFGRAAQRLEGMALAVAQWSEGEEKSSGHIITEP